jgi:hypothetical protein
MSFPLVVDDGVSHFACPKMTAFVFQENAHGDSHPHIRFLLGGRHVGDFLISSLLSGGCQQATFRERLSEAILLGEGCPACPAARRDGLLQEHAEWRHAKSNVHPLQSERQIPRPAEFVSSGIASSK